MLLVYFSKEDPFSMNIYGKLNVSESMFMYTDSIFFILVNNFLFLNNQDIENDIKNLEQKYNLIIDNPELLVISKHKSKHDIDLITLHYTGNYNIAELGGNSYELNPTNQNLFLELMKMIISQKIESPKFFIEATHHGPTLKYKSLFFEIGPNDLSYNNSNNIDLYIKIFKEVIKAYTQREKSENNYIFSLIGAEHYIDLETYNKIIEKIKEKTNVSDLTIGHIMPKYALLPLLEDKSKLEQMIREMIIKSNADIFVINKSYVKQSELIYESANKVIKEIGKEIKLIKI